MENRVEGSTRLAWSPVVRCSRCTLPVRLALNISSLLSDTRACFYYPSWPLSNNAYKPLFYIYIYFFQADSCTCTGKNRRSRKFNILPPTAAVHSPLLYVNMRLIIFYSMQAGPFFFFFQANRNSLVAEHPEKSVEEISSVRCPHCASVSPDVYVLLADAWRQMGKFTYWIPGTVHPKIGSRQKEIQCRNGEVEGGPSPAGEPVAWPTTAALEGESVAKQRPTTAALEGGPVAKQRPTR